MMEKMIKHKFEIFTDSFPIGVSADSCLAGAL